MQQTEAEAEALYDQGTEVTLLTELLDLLDNTIVLDVGAEKGSFVRALLRAGADRVYAIEPLPSNVETLQAQFGHVPTVDILAIALGARDDTVQLHIVEDKTGRLPDAYHSLVPFEETPTLRMVAEIPVRCRTLDSLVAEGTIPTVAGILKIDTERGDFDVLKGMGRFFSPVVMIEYWDTLPETVGPSAYRVAEVADFMADRGYSNYVVIKRHDEFEVLQLNRSETRPGDWGNIVFVHDTVFPRSAPIILEMLARAQEKLLDKAVFLAKEAAERLALIERLQQVAAERLALIERLQQVAAERLALIERLQQVAAERLALIERLQQVAAERLALIERLQQVAAERLALIERLQQALRRPG